jgi:hypothetical protein
MRNKNHYEYMHTFVSLLYYICYYSYYFFAQMLKRFPDFRFMKRRMYI